MGAGEFAASVNDAGDCLRTFRMHRNVGREQVPRLAGRDGRPVGRPDSVRIHMY